MRRLAVIAAASVFVVAARAAAQPRDLEVHTSVSRTAVWVADRVTYTVIVACSRAVDILADDLSKDRLRVEGLDVLGADWDRTATPDDRTIYTFRYYLTTYRVDQPELKIAPLTVRYYVRRAGQRPGDAAPAGEAQVPAAVIAFRSALADGQETYAIRDGRDAHPRPRRYASLQPIGIGLILLSIVPAGIAVIAIARRTRPRERPRSAREMRQDEEASLGALQALDVSTATGRREAYSRMNALVRDHLHAATGVDPCGLTPAEVRAAMRAHDGRLPLEAATTVLAACDEARYAPPDTLPSAESCRQTIRQAADVLGG